MVNTKKEVNPHVCNCLKCGYAWTRQAEALPKTCPRCKSYTWNQEYRRIPASVKSSIVKEIHETRKSD